jgi:hypothetical protein
LVTLVLSVAEYDHAVVAVAVYEADAEVDLGPVGTDVDEMLVSVGGQVRVQLVKVELADLAKTSVGLLCRGGFRLLNLLLLLMLP